MTLDEAIAHAREEADKNNVYCELCTSIKDCKTCEQAHEYEQLVEWLEELKTYREIGTVEKCKNNILDIQKAYNNAIDDFVVLIKEALNHDWITTTIRDQTIYNRLFNKCNKIAELLKRDAAGAD